MGSLLAAIGSQRGQDGDVTLLGQKWIPREKKCIASARHFVGDIAADWNAVGEIPDIAQLLTSEIVTNALIHGTLNAPGQSTIRITVGRDGPLMSVEVYDACIVIPRVRTADSLETCGRGLSIVATLSHKWGWHLHRHGKTVWFQLAAWPASRPSPAEPDVPSRHLRRKPGPERAVPADAPTFVETR